MTAPERYDLLVVGAGSGGIAGAIRASRHGARVAVFDDGALGGTCVNVGCVPKKAMWLAAELAEAQVLAAEVGFATTPGRLDWGAFIARRERYIQNIHGSYRRRFDELGITLLPARARFTDAHTLVADGQAYTAPRVLLATGAHPRRPDISGQSLGCDSNGFFELREAPRRVAIVGGGYIAVELAGVLRALGSEVVVFVRGERLLSAFDPEIAGALLKAMETRGVEVILKHELDDVHQTAAGLEVHCQSGEVVGGFDRVLWAIGRAPNTADLGLDEAAVALDANGFVRVDAWQETSAPGVYAVGDVTAAPALTPVAIATARRLIDRLFGGRSESKMDFENIPTVIFSHPPIGSVGLGEDQARARHGDAVRVYRSRFRPMLGALAGRDEQTLMKLVCVGGEERVVGVHLIGAAADEILQGFAVAVKLRARKADLDATVAIHPTSAEELVLMS
ncbi:MAG: glutathione-disulfide reductase [Polyangiales bacterium]